MLTTMATGRTGFRRAAVAAAAFLIATTAPTAPLAAQEGAQPRLFFTINAGVVFGGDLWTVDRQPVVIIGGAGAFDTMRISRQLTPGLAAGLTATLYTSPHFGFSFEATHLGQKTDDNCTMISENTALDPQRRNFQTCQSISQIERSVATTGFYLGANYRFAPRGAFSPYLRLQGGVTIRSSSVVETFGAFVADGAPLERLIIRDPEGTVVAPTAAIAAGVMVPLSAGYSASFEIRDHLIQMQRVTGPAVVGIAPTENFYMHAFAVTFGFSIVLEKKRGRRY